jgi:hypothetical protein
MLQDRCAALYSVQYIDYVIVRRQHVLTQRIRIVMLCQRCNLVSTSAPYDQQSLKTLTVVTARRSPRLLLREHRAVAAQRGDRLAAWRLWPRVAAAGRAQHRLFLQPLGCAPQVMLHVAARWGTAPGHHMVGVAQQLTCAVPCWPYGSCELWLRCPAEDGLAPRRMPLLTSCPAFVRAQHQQGVANCQN